MRAKANWFEDFKLAIEAIDAEIPRPFDPESEDAQMDIKMEVIEREIFGGE